MIPRIIARFRPAGNTASPRLITISAGLAEDDGKKLYRTDRTQIGEKKKGKTI